MRRDTGSCGSGSSRRGGRRVASRGQCGQQRQGDQHQQAGEDIAGLAGLERLDRGISAGRESSQEGGCQHDADHAQLGTPGWGEGDERQQPGSGRGQRAAREREVAGQADDHPARRRSGAQPPGTLEVARDAHGEHEADGRDQPVRVPVGQRLLQPAGGGRAAIQLHDPGKQPLREAVGHHHQRAQRQGWLQPPPREVPAQQRHRGDEHAEVEQRAAGRRPARARRSAPTTTDAAVQAVSRSRPARARRPGHR